MKLYPIGLEPDLVSGARPALLALGVAGVFLVLVLMVNLASVLLARATLFEGGLLGLAGGVAAALAAIWGTRTLIALAPLDLPRREGVAVDWGIGAVVVAVGVVEQARLYDVHQDGRPQLFLRSED